MDERIEVDCVGYDMENYVAYSFNYCVAYFMEECVAYVKVYYVEYRRSLFFYQPPFPTLVMMLQKYFVELLTSTF